MSAGIGVVELLVWATLIPLFVVLTARSRRAAEPGERQSEPQSESRTGEASPRS